MILIEHPLTAEERAAVIAYAATVGPDWKHQLANDWMTDRTSGLLERLRNTHGAAWLHAFHLTKGELEACRRYSDLHGQAHFFENWDAAMAWADSYLGPHYLEVRAAVARVPDLPPHDLALHE